MADDETNPTGDSSDASGVSAADEESAADQGASLPGPSGPPAAWNPEETGTSGELPGSAAAPTGWDEDDIEDG